ncbi:hypothetical protein BT69DRAFT_1281215 [Atractiella rhizophila]|nr:hypothetical protein BT69DRAFT_1281215 [Atractiella rhizophila]
MATPPFIYELVEATETVKGEIETTLNEISSRQRESLSGEETRRAESLLTDDLPTHPRVVFDKEYLTSRFLLLVENVRLPDVPHRGPTDLIFRLLVQNGFDIVITSIQLSYFLQSIPTSSQARLSVRDSAPRGGTGRGDVKIHCRRDTPGVNGSFKIGHAGTGNDVPSTIPFAIRLNHRGDVAVSLQLQVSLASSVPLEGLSAAEEVVIRTIRIEDEKDEAYINKDLMNASWNTILEDVNTEWEEAGFVLEMDNNLPLLQDSAPAAPVSTGTSA